MNYVSLNIVKEIQLPYLRIKINIELVANNLLLIAPYRLEIKIKDAIAGAWILIQFRPALFTVNLFVNVMWNGFTLKMNLYYS